MSRPWIINLGLPKSGTTTLARALRRAGLRCADFRIRQGQLADPHLVGTYVADLLYRGYFASGDPLQHLEGFDALSEVSLLREGRSVWPQMDWALLDTLRRRYPGLHFVASRRAPLAMSDSMLRWSDLGIRRLPDSAVPGLPAGFGATTAERVRWINGHYDALAQFFAGSPRYLAYDTSAPDAALMLGRFLGRDLPWWGRANANTRALPA